MIKAAIDKIQNLAEKAQAPQAFKIGGKEYMLAGGHTYRDEPSRPETLLFTTLSGIAEYINGGFDGGFIIGQPIIQVVSPTEVVFYSEAEQRYAERTYHAKAKPVLPSGFPFGSFMPGEDFIIKLQALFVQGIGDWQRVVDDCAGIKKQDGVEYKDNGVAQTVAVQSGISLAAMRLLPNPVMLAPFRTFPEVDQPVSKFILRATDGGMCPELALFEADGGAWRLEAMLHICEWLKKQLPKHTVLS